MISSTSLNLSTTIFPLHRPSNWVDRWRKILRVRRRQSYPARPHRWLGRKLFFCPISGTEFDHSWNWFGRISSQGLFSYWSKLSPKNIGSSKLVAPGSPRMAKWRPSGGEVSTECKPTCLSVEVGRYVERVSRLGRHISRVSVDISAECRSLYRPIVSTDTRSTYALSTHDPEFFLSQFH